MNGDGGRSSTTPAPSGGGVHNPYVRTNNRAATEPTQQASRQGTSGSTSHAAPPPPVAQPGASNAQGTRENYAQAIKYIDQCLVAKQYPRFEELTAEHVTGDHLIGYLSMIWNWLAQSTIVWRVTVDGDELILGKTTKMKHFKSIKAVFLYKFRAMEG